MNLMTPEWRLTVRFLHMLATGQYIKAVDVEPRDRNEPLLFTAYVMWRDVPECQFNVVSLPLQGDLISLTVGGATIGIPRNRFEQGGWYRPDRAAARWEFLVHQSDLRYRIGVDDTIARCERPIETLTMGWIQRMEQLREEGALRSSWG